MIRIIILLHVILLCLVYNGYTQVYIEDVTYTTGPHFFAFPSSIISPSIVTKPVMFSSTAQVTYLSGGVIRLKNGFNARNFTGSGFFSAYYSNTLNSSNYTTCQLQKKIDGGYYISQNGHLPVIWKEEYTNTSLDYKVYNDQGGIISSLPTTNVTYGDNRVDFDFSSLASGNYLLEVINIKKEKWYLRFKR